MEDILLVLLIGFGASFVDGALGMGFGATGSTLLMGMGLPPQLASGTVNLAKVATGIASGISHWKFKNIDKRLVIRLGIPGGLGAMVGGALVSYTNPTALKLVMATLLASIGVRLLFRFAARPPTRTPEREVEGAVVRAPLDSPEATQTESLRHVPGVEWAGAVGGLVNGMIGAWGPLVTPFLLFRRVAPRYAIGTANTAEVFVAFVSSVTIVLSFGAHKFDYRLLLSMLVGGVIAAPVAAWLIRYVRPRLMGLLTAGLLIFLNTRELLRILFPDSGTEVLYGITAAVGLTVALLANARRQTKPLPV